MTIKVGINGMGRIGRTVLREIFSRGNTGLEVVAVNNPGDPSRYVHLLRYDSVHGRFNKEVKMEGEKLNIDGQNIHFFSERDPAEIDWSAHNVDIVIDSTGVFKDKEGLGRHLKGTVKKVIMCAPGKDLDGTFVMGVNNDTYNNDEHHIVSNASCTTNCLAPLAKALHEAFEIKSGHMVTVHAYTQDQNILDASHNDLRRARAAGVSMIPTTTGAAKAVGLVIPELAGKLDGYAVRVPTPNVSMVDLSLTLGKEVTAEEINAAVEKAANGSLKGVLGYETEELVSVDFMGMRESSRFDSKLTKVMGGNTVKVVTWYDNEAGFSNRVIDLAAFMGSKL